MIKKGDDREQVAKFSSSSRLQTTPLPSTLFGKMKKEEYIRQYGEEAYEKRLAQQREYKKEHKAQERAYREEHIDAKKATDKKYREEHPEEAKAYDKKYREEHPAQVIANHQEQHRKGGEYYDKNLEYMQTGIPGEKHKTRIKHARDYKQYKMIIAPDSQIHHEWIPKTADYRGLALVETDAHMHGFVDVIAILNGKITLLTEEEVKNGKKKR